MPIKRFYGKRRRGVSRRGTRKHLRGNATQRVARVAKKRTSAKAQGKQITTIARSVTHVQKQLRESQNVDMKWRFALTNIRMVNYDPLTKGNIHVIPLTSGPIADTAEAASSTFIDTTSASQTNPDCAWEPVQPKGKSIQDNRGSVPWCKMYTGTYKLALHSNTLRKPVRYTMFVIRLAREDETDNDNTMLQRLNNIDGGGKGSPAVASHFARDEDFYSLDGFDNPVLQGNTTLQGIGQPDGHLMVQMNSQRYKVIHRRECVIGMNTVSSSGGPTTSDVTQVVQAFTPAGAASPVNQSYYETTFRINYGGAKIQSANVDGTGLPTDPITLSDNSYGQLNPKLKHWLVIFPSTVVTYPDSNPGANTATGVPVLSLEGTISTKVPA